MTLVGQITEERVEFDGDQGRFASFDWFDQWVYGQSTDGVQGRDNLDGIVLSRLVGKLNDALGKFTLWQAREFDLVLV